MRGVQTPESSRTPSLTVKPVTTRASTASANSSTSACEGSAAAGAAHLRIIRIGGSVADVGLDLKSDPREVPLESKVETMRAYNDRVLGAHELDEMLMNRDQLNHDIQGILDKQTDAWGIKVSNVEIKHVDLDESMVRAIARQAEAERERRAKVIHAEGELQASEKLRSAADVLMQSPASMQLRYLQTLTEVGNAPSSTVVFPFPLDFGPLLGKGDRGREGEGG